MRLLMTVCCLLGFALIFSQPDIFAAELQKGAGAGAYTITVAIGGFDRTAQVYVPSAYSAEKKPPLVLAFHGAGGNGAYMLNRNGWQAKAEEQGFLVVAPDGLPALPRVAPDLGANPPLWNSGQLKPNSPRARVDDVQFVAALLDTLQERVAYDAERVYATGHSNGAGMTFRIAAELSERLTAIAPVAGSMSVKDPQPVRPLPTLFIVGTKDPMQPLEGGIVNLPWGAPQTRGPVTEYLQAWAKGIGCSEKPQTLDDAGGIKTMEYASKQADGPTLKVIYLEGHGHDWAGGLPRPGTRRNGSKPTGLNATDTIWTFFAEQTKKSKSSP